jgi:hypothetical protein
MTPAVAGIVVVALALAGMTQAPTESTVAGKRVESDSYTEPKALARCIAYNITKKMPELQVRSNPGDSPNDAGYLILTAAEPSPTTFGVIRIDRSEGGSHLTTWLPDRSLSAAPEDIARKLIAGC